MDRWTLFSFRDHAPREIQGIEPSVDGNSSWAKNRYLWYSKILTCWSGRWNDFDQSDAPLANQTWRVRWLRFSFSEKSSIDCIKAEWIDTFFFHLGSSRTESNSVAGFLRSNVCSMCDADSSSENGQTASLGDRTSLSGTRKVCSRVNAWSLASPITEPERNDRFQVIQQLYTKNHDLHSIRMILAAFDHPSIFRLRDTWRTFRREKPKFYTYVFLSQLLRDDTVSRWSLT